MILQHLPVLGGRIEDRGPRQQFLTIRSTPNLNGALGSDKCRQNTSITEESSPPTGGIVIRLLNTIDLSSGSRREKKKKKKRERQGGFRGIAISKAAKTRNTHTRARARVYTRTSGHVRTRLNVTNLVKSFITSMSEALYGMCKTVGRGGRARGERTDIGLCDGHSITLCAGS